MATEQAARAGGALHPAPDPERIEPLLLPYQLRGVRVGAIAQIVTSLALVALPFADAPDTWELAWYWLLLAATGLVGVVVLVLPWSRLLTTGWGVPLLYVWSVLDIVLVTGFVVATGGLASPLWALFVPTTMLSAATYALRPQLVLLVVTVASYCAGLAAVGDLRVDVALLVRILVLAVLAAMVAKLTRELVRQLLSQQRRRTAVEERAAALARLDDLKTDFVATASHELRTPTSVIYGLARTLTARWDELDDERRHWCAVHLETAARRLRDTVVILLDFGRMESGHLAPRRAPVDLAALVRRTAAGLEHIMAEHDVRLELAELDPVPADAALLERAIEHLLVNAATHTPPGTAVEVRLQRRGRVAELSVTDDGPGIPDVDLRDVTDRFTRGGDPLTRPTRGLGIGLALVTEIAAAHAGALSVRSPGAGGASFVLTLPLDAPVSSEEAGLR